MARQHNLQELSLALTPRERNVLLEKIRKNLSVSVMTEQEEKIFHKVDTSGHRSELLKAEFNKLGLWARIALWFRKLFSSKTRDELIEEALMDRSISILSRQPVPFMASDGETVLPAFAQEVFALFTGLAIPGEVINFVWKDPERLKVAIEFSLSMNIPDAKTSMFRFIQFPELVKIYKEKGNKSDLKKSLVDVVDAYLKNIPSELFSQLEEGVLPLYWLKDLSSFDFPRFFAAFRVNIEEVAPGTHPDFKPTPIKQLIPFLDSLAYAIFAASKITRPLSIHKEILKYFTLVKSHRNLEPGDRSSDVKENQIDKESLLSIPDEAIRDIGDAFQELPDLLAGFSSKVSLADFLKVAHKDPFYRFLAYSPNLKLREFYHNSLYFRIFQELDAEFNQIRLEAIAQYKAALFPNGLKPLDYFTPEEAQVAQTGFPLFAYIEATNTLHGYIRQIFIPMHGELFRNIARIVPERMREVQNVFTFQTSALEDLMIHMERIDDFFNPVTEDGKVFYRTRVNALRDLVQQKAYRTLVSQRDQEAKEILDRGLEAFRSINEAIEALVGAKIDSVQAELSKLLDPVSGKPVKDVLKLLQERLSILRKVVRIEEAIGEEAANKTLLRDANPV